ncbi:unnamed protein product [Paramecium pentaurelia]|uniref:START domain-containing protein n=1 Tax=Paramecium pentaurelia TaxID=43138 RepID=A0A8S1TB42_9CILI|nr:unnamed protein product [Paramecium pentaurelia]
MQANYQAELEQLQANAIELAYQTIEEGKWEKEIEQDGVVFYSKPGSTGWKITRSELIAEIDPKKAVDVLRNYTRFQEYNHTAQEINLIKKIDDNISIQYILTKPNQVLQQQRDIVTLSRASSLPDGTFFVVSKSIEVPEAPIKEQYVRAEIILSFFGFKPVENGQTLVTMVQSFDPKGDAPKDLLNSLANKVVNYNKLFVENLKKATIKE